MKGKILITTLVTICTLTFCSKKGCEKEGFGTVKVTNGTSELIWVDCKYPDHYITGAYILQPSQSVDWKVIPGEIIIMAQFYEEITKEWYSYTYYLNQCEICTHSWIVTNGRLAK